jgi:uncharacterized protein YidB (DUF937 family)
VAVDALADGFENLGGGADADVGGDERVLQLVQQIGVDLLLAEQNVLDLADKAGARFLDSLFQAFKKAGHGATKDSFS